MKTDVKINKLFLAALAALLLLASCEQPAGPAPAPEPPRAPKMAVMTGIRIAEYPLLQVYARGQPFEAAGLEVEALYDDESVKTLSPADYTVNLYPPDPALPGMKTVYVQKGDFAEEFYVYTTYSTSVLQSIAVSAQPSRTSYFWGQNFDRTGLKISGNYYDAETRQTTQADIDPEVALILGYDKGVRGAQNLIVRVNGHDAPQPVPVTVRVPSNATVTESGGKWIYIMGQNFTVPQEFAVTVKANGMTRAITGLGAEVFSGYANPLADPGNFDITLTLDDKVSTFNVRVIDFEPELYFDYGFMRHGGDPQGYGPNKAAWDASGGGRYYVTLGQKLVIAPVRALLGYGSDHADLGVTYNWTITGSAGYTDEGRNGEFLRFTASETGTWEVGVAATGRDFATGETVTKEATTKIICFAPPESPQSTGKWLLQNYAPGQFTEGGTGFKWSLGAFGGYMAWKLDNEQESVHIEGNAFAAWLEPGIVWVMRDDNGNGLPYETWYELRGSEDRDPVYRRQISRRMAMKYFGSDDGPGSGNSYGQVIRSITWADARGRCGIMPGGWSAIWGVDRAGGWVVYTGTMLRDNGNINEGCGNAMYEYVDTMWGDFTTFNAIYPDGAPVSNLGKIRFVKVHTGVFKFPGGGVGEVSTEIYSADTIGQRTGFPLPKDS